MASWDTARKNMAARNGDNVYIETNVEKVDYGKDKEFIVGRLYPKFYDYMVYPFKIKTKGGVIRTINKTAMGYLGDGNWDEKKVAKDPYAKLAAKYGIAPKPILLFNWIDRALQENAPRKQGVKTAKEEKTGFKEKGSSAWTPVRVFQAGASLQGLLMDMNTTNKVKTKDGTRKAFTVDHPKFGCNIEVKYDKDRPPASQYSLVKGERAPLTEEELEYLVWDIQAAIAATVEAVEAAGPNATRLETMLVDKDGKPLAGKSKSSSDDEDEDEDEDEDIDLDEDEAPKKKKKPIDDEDDDEDERPAKKPAKKKVEDDDEDDDIDFDDGDDEDEEEVKKPSKKPSKKKKPAYDDDEDGDDDDLDFDSDDDEDDERPTKKPAKKPVKKKVEDDEDEDLDDDEDERPAKKPGKKPAKKKVEEDFDDDDEDEKPAKKPVKKKKKVEDDDEDIDFDDDDDTPF